MPGRQSMSAAVLKIEGSAERVRMYFMRGTWATQAIQSLGLHRPFPAVPSFATDRWSCPTLDTFVRGAGQAHRRIRAGHYDECRDRAHRRLGPPSCQQQLLQEIAYGGPRGASFLCGPMEPAQIPAAWIRILRARRRWNVMTAIGIGDNIVSNPSSNDPRYFGKTWRQTSSMRNSNDIFPWKGG